MKVFSNYSFIFAALFIAFVSLPIIGNGWGKVSEKIKVACIGDSITFGARLDNPEEESYPARLQKLLGGKYLVENFGVSSCTLIRKGIPTVWTQLSKIKEANPNIVVISLGTNDTCGEGACGDRKCWEYKDEFEGDYNDLIDTLRTWPSQPKIWICAPSPMVLETPGLSEERVQGLSLRKPRLQELNQIIKKVAENKKVGFIDLNTPLAGKAELFTEQDGVHPNEYGYFAIAKLVYREIKKEI
ncbi:GDSL-type esterase/lipase family protein [Mariniphaga sp.]|uniref:GDSL-type esterase/lipase family protein n=1 Tax=Mariniphaga sp. TaxID=1954475 RepID=UPI00356AAC6C